MTSVRLPMVEALLAARRSTFPLGPHFTDSMERATLARVLYTARREVLCRPAGRNRWSRGYHVRALADALLRADGLPELADRVWACPMWRGLTVTGHEAAELATDGLLAGLARVGWEEPPPPGTKVTILPRLGGSDEDSDKD